MHGQPLEELVLVTYGAEAGVTERAPHLYRLQPLDPGSGLGVEARHRVPGLNIMSYKNTMKRLLHLSPVTRPPAHLARLGAGAAPGTRLAVTTTFPGHDQSSSFFFTSI